MGLSGPRTWPGPPDSKRSGGRSQGSERNEAGRAETGGGVAGGSCCREGVTVTSAGGWQEAVGQLLGRELGEKPRAGISPVSLPPLLLLLTVMSAQSSRVSMTFSCLDCPPRVVYQTLESSGFLLLEGGCDSCVNLEALDHGASVSSHGDAHAPSATSRAPRRPRCRPVRRLRSEPPPGCRVSSWS